MTPARQQLIADLEAAPCGSPELDARIAIERGLPNHKYGTLPRWTTNTHTAMELIPDDAPMITIHWDNMPEAGVKIWPAEADGQFPVEANIRGGREAIPLAICAAVLKIGS